jgi:O-antigen/teichoic acid export membrane protein
MGSTAKKAVSHAGIYALGNVLRNAVSFIMLPIYTRYLTPSDYGVIELLSMLIDFVSIILGMRLAEAIFRFYSTSTVIDDQKIVISTSLFLSVLLNGIGAVMVMLLSDPLAHLLFGDYTYAEFVKLFALTLLLQAFIEVPLIYIRAQQRPWLFIGFSLFKLALQLGLNIYFVVIKGMHVEGVIYSALISGGVMATLLMSYTLSSVGVRISYRMSTDLVRFSVPLMLASVGSFYLTFGDRYFLRLFGDLADVGIYALGYKFGFILTVLMWDPFEKIWATQRYEVHKRPDARFVFQRTFVFMSVLMLSAALGISLFVKDLLVVMSDPAFHAAHAIVPIILAAYVIQAWTNYCYFGLLLGRNTMQITYGSAIAVIVITIAYAGLIPLFGVFGAAWATVIGFTARLIWVYRKSKLDYDMQLPWRKVGMLGGLATCIYALSWLAPDQFLPSVIVRSILFLLFFIIFMKLPILSAGEKNVVIKVLKNPKSFKQALA